MKKIIFIDRDGTLIVEPPITFQVNSLEEMSFVPEVILALSRLQKAGYILAIVTNQDGLGTDANPRENYEKVNAKMLEIFESQGVKFDFMFECPHYVEDNCNCRKPKTGMVDAFLRKTQVDFENSYMIGDRSTDIEFAKNLEIKGFDLREMSWGQIADSILQNPRTAQIKRKTKETEIDIFLNLDGSGKYTIDTGLKFFDHMLEQIGKHGNFDLNISITGDLEVDEHHTIEDCALALGEAFKNALGDKRGITRYAHEKILPMDEALAMVAIDFSGRSGLVFDALFTREYVGDFPTEMLKHFYQSFCDASGLNMNMKIEGENTHHMVEISFKAFARVLREAVKKDGDDIVSTKGVL